MKTQPMSQQVKKSLVLSIYFTLAVSTLLVFWQVRNFNFVNYDDPDYVSKNQHIQTGFTVEGVIWAFTTNVSANWHPLTWLSLMLDCQLFGPDPGRIHLVNLLLHIINTLLLFAVLKKMTGSLWPSAFVAAAFALHPMHVESVAWIAERKDVLSALFWFLTMGAYLAYVRRPGAFRYTMTLVLFALGLLTKPMLVTLPFVLLLLDYWPLGRFAAPRTVRTAGGKSRNPAPIQDGHAILYRIIIEKIPFFILVVISSVITLLVMRGGGAVVNTNELSFKSRLANVFLSYSRYIDKMFWPQNLAIFYPFDLVRFPFWQIIFCVLLVLIISVCVIRFRLKHKYLFVGWFWFVGTLIPVIGLIQVGAQAYADRYTYIPYIGLFIMVAWGLPQLFSKWPHRKIALGAAMAVVLVFLGIVAHRQVSHWNNTSNLFLYVTKVTQNNYVAYNNLGVAYSDLGRYPEAIEAYRQTIRIKPDDAGAYYNLSYTYDNLGRYEEEIEACKQAIRIKPDYAEACYNLGCAYGKLGRWPEAIEAYRQTIRIKPDLAEAYNNLGAAYSNLGRYPEAMEAFRQAIQIKPDYAEAHYDLANALKLQGKLDEAAAQLRVVVRLKSDWPAPMSSLAMLIASHPEIKSRDVNEAIRIAGRACELTNYNDPVMMDTLAAAYASAGKFGEAIDTAKRAIVIADAANQPQIKNVIQYHLTFYTQGKPYIEAPQKTERK